MTKTVLTVMRRARRLKLGFVDTLMHFAIVGVMLLLSGIFLWDLSKNGVATGTVAGAAVFIALAGLFYYLQRRALKFRMIKAPHSAAQFKEAVMRTADQLNWRIENNNAGFASARRGWNWTASWGELITILRDDEGIMINSICDPDHPSITAYGWNKKNVHTFLVNLNDVIRGVDPPAPIEEDTELSGNEWSAKRILARLVFYPVSLALFAEGVSMILNPIYAKTVVAGFGLLILGSIYIYADVKILLQKRKKRQRDSL